jgi:hypothetical protein
MVARVLGFRGHSNGVRRGWVRIREWNCHAAGGGALLGLDAATGAPAAPLLASPAADPSEPI